MAEQKKKKETKRELDRNEGSSRLRSRRLRIGLVVVFSCLLIFSIGFLWWNSFAPSAQTGTKPGEQDRTDTPKAVILDGLYVSSPNIAFVQSLKGYLSNAGFRVDVFEGENVTIDLLRSVGGYKVLILRLHSAVHSDGFLYLFSGEKYSQSKYTTEQLQGAVRKGVTFEGDEFFALNAVFLGGNNDAGLSGSTIILMGCNGTTDAMAIQRLFGKGVNIYVGWNGYVDLSYSDQAVLTLMRDLYVDKMTVGEAVVEVMREVGPDPVYKSVMEYRIK